MKLSWKLLPVATLFALGVMFISFAGGKSAYAIDTVTTPGTAAIGTPVIISASITPTTTGLITLAAFSSTPNFGVFTSVPAAPTVSTLEPITGSGGTTLQFTAATASTRTLQAYFVCNSSIGNYLVSFTLAVAGIPTGQGSLSCGIGGVNPGTGQLTIYTTSTVLPIGGQGSFTATATTSTAPQYITVSSTPLLINFQQANSNLAGLGNTYDTITGQNTTSLFITANGQGPRTITGTFICNTTGTATLTISLSQALGVPSGQTAYSQAVICGTGLVSPTVGPASAVTVAASPTSVGCNGTAFVTVTVRNALGGYVADGTSVSLTSNVGSLSPTTATTLGGGVLAVFTAPSNQSGTANISASAAGTAQGTATIAVTCNASTPTPAIPPTIYIPPVISNIITGGGNGGGSSLGTGIISPPNTGDAGLATDNTWQLYAGIALVVMSAAAGAVVVVRTRA